MSEFPSSPSVSYRRHAADPISRSLVIALAALVCIGGVAVWRLAGSGTIPAAPPANVATAAANLPIYRLSETVKGLDGSQQQLIDQLQNLQDALLAQQSESKKSSERLALLNGKLDALQQSFASIQPSSADEGIEPRQIRPAPKLRASGARKARAHVIKPKTQRTAAKRT